MKRKILIPLGMEEYEVCAECGRQHSDPKGITFRSEKGVICMPCALSCAWCEERSQGEIFIIGADRQIVCKACADFTEASE